MMAHVVTIPFRCVHAGLRGNTSRSIGHLRITIYCTPKNYPLLYTKMVSSLIDTAIGFLPSKGNGNVDRNPEARYLIGDLGTRVNDYPLDKPYSAVLDKVPITIERLPYIPKHGSKLVDAGTPRANFAPTVETPAGTQDDDWVERHKHMTVLQQHASYWDKDADGIIWPTDVWLGIRAWGWNLLLSAFATFIISAALSYPTGPSYLPDPLFRIHIPNIHKDKHGSDSMSFDNEGRFVPQNLEDFFAKYDRGRKGGLDVSDIAKGLKGQRMAFDFFGWSAAFLEWTATYLLVWPADGILRKEDVRRVIDGSLFQHKADQYAAKLKKEGSTSDMKP
ncbi:Caleosin-domain-containing protein [Polychaeton citri CBS 116435]|uniref:Caleosin-domain-containing protein n=1 Tax=Polychaeton citri CBS 116435 TaxID=1314669 RepID=A0A9P4Q0H3_9PEZI|nr:Caleosin-domain-containing protein [Polychaeton citri CBS 116435]